MKHKTQVAAENGKQELLITRAFNLPVEMLFQAYVDPKIVAQWMGTNVVRLENKKYGSYRFETADASGNIVVQISGVYHEFVPNQKITRTFEMEGSPFPAQLEFLEFEALTERTSKLQMHIVFRSIEYRDQLLQLPFAQGINMAHNRLEETLTKIK